MRRWIRATLHWTNMRRRQKVGEGDKKDAESGEDDGDYEDDSR